MSNFGELLRRLRGNRSQREVAAELQMPITTLSTLENQSAIPRGPVLKKLSAYYGVAPTYFYAPATSEMKSSDSAREWLQTVKRQSNAKETIAMYAPPDIPEDTKKKFTEKIREKKHAGKATHRR